MMIHLERYLDSHHKKVVKDFLTGGGGSRLRRFLVLSLFYRGGGGGGNGFIAEKLYFPKDPEGVQHFQGRSIQGGIQMLIAITITCDF